MNLWSDVVVPRYFSHCQARPLFSNTGCVSCLENRGKFCWEKEIKPSSLTMHSINAYPLRGEPQGPAVSTLGRLGCQVNLGKSALERILKPTELKMLNNELYCHMLAFSTPLLGCPVPLKALLVSFYQSTWKNNHWKVHILQEQFSSAVLESEDTTVPISQPLDGKNHQRLLRNGCQNSSICSPFFQVQV